MRISANDEVREISRLREETEYNRISEQNTAMEEGVKKGKPDERAKAAAEKIEIAKSLLSMGLSVEQVSQATWLSVDEVNSLNKLLK